MWAPQSIIVDVSIAAGHHFVEWNSHSGHLRDPSSSDRVGFEVAEIDFPAYMAKLKPESLLLKMDVEGEETAIFPDLLPHLPAQCAIFFETHSGERGWNQAVELFTADGYPVEHIIFRGAFYDGYAFRR